MRRAIIVDDEPKLIEVLKFKLNRTFPLLSIVATASSVSAAFDQIQTHKPDIVFLDISMPRESGFDLLKKFKLINFKIIFVTGFNGHVLNLLKLSGVDYILKPIDHDDLTIVINKLKQPNKGANTYNNYEILKENVNLIGDQNSKVVIPEKDSFKTVILSNIIRFESSDTTTKIHLVSKEIISSLTPISEYIKVLKSYNFYSPHRSLLINNVHLKKHKESKEVLILNDDTKVSLLPNRKSGFLSSIINKFLKG